MPSLTPIILLAVFCGLVVAGFVWFAWGVFENLFAGMKKKKLSADDDL